MAFSGLINRITAIAASAITGLGTGIAAWLAAPSSANLLAAMTTKTGTGNLVFGTAPTLSNPIVGTQAATDNSTLGASTGYVTTAIANAVAGVNPAVAVQAATTANVSGYTYANGVNGVGATLTQNSAAAVTIDGYVLLLNDRVLFKNQTSAFQNGVYILTTLGTGIIPAVFIRALDYNQPSEINNTGAIPVVNGTANALTSWLLTSTVVTIGTDSLTYSEFAIAPAKSGIYASKPSSPNTGQQYLATDLGTAGVWIFYDGTKWKPIGGQATIYLNAVQTTMHTGDILEATVFTYVIPAGLVSANGGIRWTASCVATGINNTKNYRMRLSTTSGSAGGTLLMDVQDSASQLGYVSIRSFFNRNSQSSQVTGGSSNAGTGATTATSTTSAINMANVSYMNFDVINANSSDTSGFDAIHIEWLEA